MKVTYNWLKDFVEITLSPQELADKLTMAGLEVTGLDNHGGDPVFEIEITSNRPDWLSVAGIAREIAAITKSKLRAYSVERIAYRKKLSAIRYPLSAKTIKISIEDRKDCPLYTANLIQGTKVKQAPDWMRQRLESVGCRSINNIVDITNYILFSLGEPLHAFDLDKIVRRSPVAGRQLDIIIRRAKKGEELVTIDGEKRTLSEDILVIAADEITGRQADRRQGTGKPIAIAGIIGGKDTEVDENTRNVLLEAAIFNPLLTRRARQALGVQTESSYRFERGVDPGMVQVASESASELILEHASAECFAFFSSGTAAIKKRQILLDAESAQKNLGITIGPTQIKSILTRLGFTVQVKEKRKMQVVVPSFRIDVAQEVDLIEELARIRGYENIPPTLPKTCLKAADHKKDLLAFTKDILVGLGLQEVITYSLVDRESLRGLCADRAPEVLNPLSKDQEVLRTTLAPGLLTCVSRNLNQQELYVAIFETAKRFVLTDKNVPGEELMLGIALCGARPRFVADGLIKDKMSILHLKGITEVLFERLGISDHLLQIGPAGAVTVKIKGEDIGAIFEAKKDILERWDIKNKEVFILEISLEKVFASARTEKKFKPLPLYPAITRDISLVIKEDLLAGDILTAVRLNAPSLLAEVKIADFYKGRQIPPGYKGLTVSCAYRSAERTLTEEEIAPLHASICGILQDRFGAKIR
ncbi:MAG: phenylalanine--tRNA ligase subunit beta [Candidatus Omnitrophica bacterium]|nr:phenylalanine--tRNA ligase subunit beta [Candidatus Omnitrophota bacterium]